jgi:hypothetical protein
MRLGEREDELAEPLFCNEVLFSDFIRKEDRKVDREV